MPFSPSQWAKKQAERPSSRGHRCPRCSAASGCPVRSTWGGRRCPGALPCTPRWCRGQGSVHTGKADDLGSKIVPGADALAGAVVQAVLVGHAQLQDLVGEVAALVGLPHWSLTTSSLPNFLPAFTMVLTKFFAVVAVQPRGAHDKVAVAELLHILFAHELGGAVGADGPGQGASSCGMPPFSRPENT